MEKLARQSKSTLGGALYREDPVDGQVEYLADTKQINERPQKGSDEGGDDDEQEEVSATDEGWRRARHADDSENLHRLRE